MAFTPILRRMLFDGRNQPFRRPWDEHFYRYLQAQKSEDAAKFAAMGRRKRPLSKPHS